jgi:hypothetical protein
MSWKYLFVFRAEYSENAVRNLVNKTWKILPCRFNV